MNYTKNNCDIFLSLLINHACPVESENEIGLYFNLNEGQEIMREFGDIINGFTKKGGNLSENEMDTIKSFIESFVISDTDNIDFLSYLFRIYKGHFFRNRYPNISFI